MKKEYFMTQNGLYWICNCWNIINNIVVKLREVEETDGHET